MARLLHIQQEVAAVREAESGVRFDDLPGFETIAGRLHLESWLSKVANLWLFSLFTRPGAGIGPVFVSQLGRSSVHTPVSASHTRQQPRVQHEICQPCPSFQLHRQPVELRPC